MEIRQQAAALFQNFIQKGTLGEGATRTDKLSFGERSELAMYPMGLDAFAKQDNVDGMDEDPAKGSFRMSVPKFNAFIENGLAKEIEQGLEELTGPTPDPAKLSPEKLAELKKEMQQMVEMGIMTQEELDAALSGKPAPTPEKPAGGEYIGTIQKDANENFYAIVETTTESGATKDVECFKSEPNGNFFLSLVPGADGIAVTAKRMDFSTDQEYKEEMFLAR